MPLPITTMVCDLSVSLVAIIKRLLSGASTSATRRINSDGAVLVRRLPRMRIEVGHGQLVDLGIVHGNENLAGLDGVGHKSLGAYRTALRLHDDAVVGLDAGLTRVGRIDFEIDARRVELAEHGGFARPCLC